MNEAIRIVCRTNLDLGHEEWPEGLFPTVPRKGDRIQSKTVWKDDFQLELEVVAVTWRFSKTNGWYAEIELHVPSYWSDWTMREFYEFYAPKIGRRPGAFI